MKPRSNIVLTSLLVVAFGAASSAHAANYWWDGNTGNWETLANWSTTAAGGTDPTVVPLASVADALTFNTTDTNANTTIYLNGNRGGVSNTANITINNTGTTTFSGGTSATPASQTLSSSGFTVNAGAGAVTLSGGTASAGLRMGNGNTIANNSSNLLTIGSTLGSRGTSGTPNFTLGGTGNIFFSGVIGLASGGTGANVAITKTGTGILSLSGANIYNAGTTISAGTLTFLKTSAKSTAGSANHVFAAGTTLGLGVGATGYYNSTDITTAFAGTGNLTGNLTRISVTATTNVGIDTTAGDFDYTESITGSPTKGLVKLGSNTLRLSGANTYTGGTTVSTGTLTFLNTGAKPEVGTADFAAGTTLGLGVGATGYFTSTDITNAFAGTMTQNITVNATTNVGIDTTAGDFDYTESIMGSPTKVLAKLGANTLTLSGANTYSSGTTVRAGKLLVGNAEALGSTAGPLALSGVTAVLDMGTYTSTVGDVTITDGKITGGSSGGLNAGAIMVGNNSNPTASVDISGLTLAGSSFKVQGAGANGAGAGQSTPVTISSGTLSTTGDLGIGRWAMTINGTSTVTVGGVIGGGGIVTSSDWGTLTIQDSAVVTATGGVNGNTEAWQLNLNGGTLNTPSIQASDRESGGTSRLVFNGTRVVATGNNTAFVTVGANADATNSALVGNGGAIFDSAGYGIGIGVNLKPDTGSTGSLTKQGAGTLTLSGNNTYAGSTTITAGTLILSGTSTSTTFSVSDAATLTNNAPSALEAGLALTEGAILTGTGNFSPLPLLGVTVTADLAGTAFTSINLDNTTLTKSGTLAFTLSNPTVGTYEVFSGTSPAGFFSSVSVAGSLLVDQGGNVFSAEIGGFSYTYNDSFGANSLLVAAIPEPDTWLLVGIGIAFLLYRKPRRRLDS